MFKYIYLFKSAAEDIQAILGATNEHNDEE